MYFWSVKKLNKDLEVGLTEKENFKYLFAYILLGLIILFVPVDLNFYEIISAIMMVILTIIGLVLFYKINWWEKWKDLLSRYFAIGFVSFIRSLVFILLPLIILFWIVLWFVYWENIPLEATIYDVIFSSLYLIGFIFLNIKYLKNLVKK